jgi:hypothetical protein
MKRQQTGQAAPGQAVAFMHVRCSAAGARMHAHTALLRIAGFATTRNSKHSCTVHNARDLAAAATSSVPLHEPLHPAGKP